MGFQLSLQGGEDLDGKGREEGRKNRGNFPGFLDGPSGYLLFPLLWMHFTTLPPSPLLPKQHYQLSKLLSKDKSFTKPALMSQPNVLLTFLLGNLSIFSKPLILAHSSTYPRILVVCIHASARHQLPCKPVIFSPSFYSHQCLAQLVFNKYLLHWIE